MQQNRKFLVYWSCWDSVVNSCIQHSSLYFPNFLLFNFLFRPVVVRNGKKDRVKKHTISYTRSSFFLTPRAPQRPRTQLYTYLPKMLSKTFKNSETWTRELEEERRETTSSSNETQNSTGRNFLSSYSSPSSSSSPKPAKCSWLVHFLRWHSE